MPLLMIDLDNTLIDRDAAFAAGAEDFLRANHLPADDLGWITGIDASGYTPRPQVQAALAERYPATSPDRLRDFLDRGVAPHVRLEQPTRDALIQARTTGWTCVIVTNGRTLQQTAKIRNTGLDVLVDAWVISEEAGCGKPEEGIFALASARAGASLRGAWMIGDSPAADIAGASRLGLRSVWISAGQPWTETSYAPTLIAANAAEAIAKTLQN